MKEGGGNDEGEIGKEDGNEGEGGKEKRVKAERLAMRRRQETKRVVYGKEWLGDKK